MAQPRAAKTVYCSFCGNNQHEVFCLVTAGVGVGICDECVAAAHQIVVDKKIKAGCCAVLQRVAIAPSWPSRESGPGPAA